jgi:hypothetical protein
VEEEKSAKSTWDERCILGECIEADVPGLGSIHVAEDAVTGTPCLVLLGNEAWKFEGSWEVQFSGSRKGGVRVRTIQAPPSAQREEFAKLVNLAATMLRRVEKDPRVQALFEKAWRRRHPWRWRARQLWRSAWGRAAVVLVLLALGLGLGLFVKHQLAGRTALEDPNALDTLPEDAPAYAE